MIDQTRGQVGGQFGFEIAPSADLALIAQGGHGGAVGG